MSLGRAGHIRKIDERQFVLRGKQRAPSDHISLVHQEYNVYSTGNTRYILFIQFGLNRISCPYGKKTNFE